MKLFAPKYYKDFSCIAEKCTHNCCIGWEIDIDPDSAKKYNALDSGYGKNIKNSIGMSEVPHFVLEENKRCPHLDENGLCKIICELGEEYLCRICREHPRFYNDFLKGKEVGLGMACEEAARIILSSDEYDVIEHIGDLCGECCNIGIDTHEYRKEIYSILKNDSIPYDDRLHAIYERFDISPHIFEDAKWHEIIEELEYLDAAHKELFLSYSSLEKTPKEIDEISERALAYFIYRHCTCAFDYEEYLAMLGFCLFLERLFVSVYISESDITPEVIGRIISEEIEYSPENTQRIINELYFW